MKKIFALVATLSASAVVATAQNQQNQQNQTCRDISAGGYIAPDEVIMQTQSGYVACRVFKLLPAAAKNETVPAPAPVPAPPPVSAPAPAPTPVPATMAGFGVLGASNFGQSRVPKVQVATGYQYNSVNFSGNAYGYLFSTNRVNTNGAFVQLMMNLNRYVSPVGNVDISYKNYNGANYLLTYIGGVQAYPATHGQWSPFGRAMFGAGTLHICCGSGSWTGFAWQVGGGLDWRPRRESRMAVRLGTFDFARVSKYGINANSLKMGTGIVF